MSSIDDRVVNMQFNNTQFQQGVAETSKSLDDLKNNLKLDGATSGIDNVQSAADHFSLAGIESALQNVSSHFSIFGAVGFTVIQDLTNSALNAGRMIAGGIIDPLVQGGASRALALQQAKFQFEGLGLDVQSTMNAALGAVKGTAFGLDDAATAAAQFGASGITATTGLEGVLRSVAGVAAQTGSSYSSVAQIFESVAGNGRLMGQDLLQLSSRGVNAAAVLAKSMGTTEENVRSLVTKGKISFKEFSDAMSGAFGANASKANETYSGALSNMHAALARIGADVASPYFLDMRDVLNSLGPVFDNIHTAITPLLTEFAQIQNISSANLVKFFNAWDLPKLLGAASPGLAAAMNNIFNLISKIGQAIGGGFKEIFPGPTVDQVTKIASAIAAFTSSLIPGSKALDDIKRTFAGVFAILDIGVQIVLAIGDGLGKLFGYTAKGTGGFLDFTAKIGDWLVKLDEAIKKGQIFNKFFVAVAGVLATPIAVLKVFFGIIADGIKDLSHLNLDGFKKFGDDVATRFSALNKLAEFFGAFWTGVMNVAKAVWNFLQPIFSGIATAIGKAVDSTKSALKGLKFDDALQAINTGIFGAFLLILKGFFGNIGGVLQGNGLAIVSSFKKVFGQLQLNLKALEMNTNAKTLETIAISVALLAASAVALSLVDSGKLTVALAAIAGLMTSLVGAFKVFGTLGGKKGLLDAIALSVAIQGIAVAILVLSGAIAILGAIPIGNIVKGVLALVVILGALVLTMRLLKDMGPGILFAAGAIAILAPAMAILAGAVAILGVLPINKLIKGVGAFTAILGDLVGALTLLKGMGPGVVLAAGAIAILAPAMAALAGAVAILGVLPINKLIKGVGAFTLILVELVGAIILLNKGGGPSLVFAAVALTAMAVAMAGIVGVVALLGNLKMGVLIQGLVGLAIALGIMAGAMAIMQSNILGAASMVIAAVAITILAAALKIVATMSWDDIGRTMVVLAGSLLILAGAMALMGLPPVLLGSIGILAASAAMMLLAPALVLLGTMSWDAIGRGLTVLAAGLVIMAVGGLLLIPASVGFLLLGAAILLIGTGIYQAAAGVALLAVAVTALVAVGGAGITLFIAGMDAFITKLPALGAAFGAAMVAMATVIGNDAPTLVVAFTKILNAMLDSVDQTIPHIIVVATHIIVAFINALVVLIPTVVTAGMKILVGVLTGIGQNIGNVVTAGTTILVNFLEGIAKNIHRVTDAAADVVVKFVQGTADSINSHRKAMETAGKNLAFAIADGMTGGLASKVRDVVNGAKNLVANIPNVIKSLLHIASPSKVTTELGEFTGEGFAVGVDNKVGRVTDSATGLGQAAVSGIKTSIAGISDALKEGIDTTPTIRPVIDTSGIKDGAAKIGSMLQTPSLSLNNSADVATSVALQEQAKNAQLVLARDNVDPATGKQVVFNQYNTSPVALTTPEIYRQTQNQLSTLKGELGVVTENPSNK